MSEPTKPKRVFHNYIYEGKTFTNTQELLKHMLVTGKLTINERRFNCRYCNEVFAHPTGLAIHIYSKHQDRMR